MIARGVGDDPGVGFVPDPEAVLGQQRRGIGVVRGDRGFQDLWFLLATLSGGGEDTRVAEGIPDPYLQLAGGLWVERSIESANEGKENRITTVAITRFGFEGKLGPYVTFRSEFEKNIGAHGSGIWEGTGSFSVRDQQLKLARWGFSIAGGIVLDEASVDFISLNIGDLLYADKYTRNPLLYSGFNRGQGLVATYDWKDIDQSDETTHVMQFWMKAL